MTIPKTYIPSDHEDKTYSQWDQSGYFNPDNLGCGPEAENYCIVMPPPNVTGTLHMGHAGMLAYQDILVRYHRMKGYRTLWLPGTDHAAIATQTKVEKLIKQEGTDRHKLGRVEFLKRVGSFAQASHDTIVSQVRKMGSSCDWSREAFTLDAPRTKAVRSVFKLMYDDGLVYRGQRVVNWCPRCHSTLADDEVEYEQENGKLYWLKYGPFVLATARPETKLGDTAVAVHPDDKRYKEMVGKRYMIKGVLGEFEITVVADREVDPEFGSGAIKVTPSHSFVDSEIARRHGLPFKQIIDEDGRMMDNCGKYCGMTTQQARSAIVGDMEKMGLIDHIDENYKHNVAVCYRCNEKIEPIPSQQWFIDVNKKLPQYQKSIKQLCTDAVKKGIFGNNKIRIIPKRFEKDYFHWIDNLRDWNISRQIWYGHTIPVWHKGDETYVGIEPPAGKGWVQDTDTLDTWFSSGLWTFSTLAHDPKQITCKNGKLQIDSDDFEKFHPTAVLETGYDILFFWVARMIIMTTYSIGDIPFQDVYLHGLVLDKQGKKMSKSKGNVIDPLDMIGKYGTDATRLSLVMGSTPGTDIKLSEEKVAGFRNLVNKLWNIGRYVSANYRQDQKLDPRLLASSDVWIAEKMMRLIEQTGSCIGEYKFSQAGEALRKFMWDDLADWYIEASKFEQNPRAKQAMLSMIFEDLLKLWHPYIPFVTERLWETLGKDGLLMVADWPQAEKYQALVGNAEKTAKDFKTAMKIISALRNMRNMYGIENSQKVKLVIVGASKQLQAHEKTISNLRTGVSEIEYADQKPPISKCYAQSIGPLQIFVPLQQVIDVEKEKARLQNELASLEKLQGSLRKKIGNEKFMSKAPEQIIAKTKEKVSANQEKIKKIMEFIASLS